MDGKTIKEPKNILNEEKKYFEKLYSEGELENDIFTKLCDLFTKNNKIPKICDIERGLCDSDLLEAEILATLKLLQNGKSPCSDGLTAEFYKFLWIDIRLFLVDSIKYLIENGELSIEQKWGIITLIPKKEKNRLFLINWKPITLLNVDYKILAKSLANRLCKVLPHIINEDQTGYIKGRFIAYNIWQIEDVIIYGELNHKPGLILTVDFEKVFDSINWNFIDQTLESFNFGPVFWGGGCQDFFKFIYSSDKQWGHPQIGFTPCM